MARGYRRVLVLTLMLAAGAAAGQVAPFPKGERQMLELVNRDRAEHKLPPVAWRDDLANIARAHSLDMKTHHFMGHESPTTGKAKDRLAKAEVAFRAAGENIAVAPDVSTGQKWLMASPKHRGNILKAQFTHLGVGIHRNDKGWLVITQLFLTPPPDHDVAALHKQIVDGISKARSKKGLRRLLEDKELTDRALSHSEHAAMRGDYDPLWLEDRLAKDKRRWRIHEAAFFLTDDIAQVIACDVAQSRRHDHFGLGVVQGDVHGKAKGALWVTLVCAQKK